ncbi:MAG TPA: hypothetical protein VKT77_14610 [Chthonomonadaceae bacterium]|nr:hypothetical protein [Chthonomonadaceae bacterium]
MASVGPLQSSPATTGALVQAAEQNTAVAATLLKKTTDADKDLVNTLLPPGGAIGGRLDIRA